MHVDTAVTVVDNEHQGDDAVAAIVVGIGKDMCQVVARIGDTRVFVPVVLVTDHCGGVTVALGIDGQVEPVCAFAAMLVSIILFILSTLGDDVLTVFPLETIACRLGFGGAIVPVDGQVQGDGAVASVLVGSRKGVRQAAARRGDACIFVPVVLVAGLSGGVACRAVVQR